MSHAAKRLLGSIVILGLSFLLGVAVQRQPAARADSADAGVTISLPQSSKGACRGGGVVLDFEVTNTTGITQAFSLNYAGAWRATGPATTGEIAHDDASNYAVLVWVPWTAHVGDADILTITAADATGVYTATATATSVSGLCNGMTDLAPVPAGREVRAPSVVYVNGKLYKIGGYGYVGGTGAARGWLDIYDIATDTWSEGAGMPAARYWMDCVAIAAKIYCAGGYETSAKDTLYIYDIALNSWSTGTSLPANRYNYAGVQLGSRYYVIGGYSGAVQATMIAYDPDGNTWDSTPASMGTARRYFHAGVVDGQIYVAGGYNGDYLRSAEIYSPTGNAWKPLPDMPTPWVNGADAEVLGRFLVVLGGSAVSTAAPSQSTLAYDTLGQTWHWMPDMDHTLYGSEAAGDGHQVWVTSGRLYEGGTWTNSPYTFALAACPDPVFLPVMVK